MKNECTDLAEKLGLKPVRCISYSQLKRILKQTDYTLFNQINQDFWGVSVRRDEDRWYALDGKELRGSIDTVKGEKRAQNLVSRTQHTDGQSLAIGFYNGSKESEKVSLRDYFAGFSELKGRYSLDALHLSEGLLSEIHRKGGVYLMQLKQNQKHLFEDCRHIERYLPEKFTCRSDEKGHGRQETRIGRAYLADTASFAERWAKSGIQSLLVLDRSRTQSKTGKTSREKSYWISNLPLSEANFSDLFAAVRRHWQIEVHHYLRDRQIGEDAMICRNENESRFLATCITLTINLLNRQKPENRSVLRELLAQRRTDVFSLFDRSLIL